LAWLICISLALAAGETPSANAAKAGELTLDPPTLHCLGVQWLVTGDANANATATIAYRKAGSQNWLNALPLLRVTPDALPRKLPTGTALFAGSVLDLDPDAEYQLRLTLSDPDGGGVEKTLTSRTRGEPIAPAPLRTLYVAPGTGGGRGTRQDPFKGLTSADAAARPGDLILLASGDYEAPFTVTKSGAPGKPIIYRAAEQGAAIAGPAPGGKRPERGVSATDIADVWFEGLDVRDVDWGIVAHRSQRIVVRRCHIYNVDYGFTCTDGNAKTRDFFLADNTVEGPCTWPRTKGIEDPRGFQISGAGHVVCYNRVRGFADGIDTFGNEESRATDVCNAIDVYGNEISEMTDDGIETDYSQQNCRFFRNRITNCFQGISEQPVFGGPVYIFRNAIYNIEVEPFKMHTSGGDITSGFLIFHNTCVKQGLPWLVWTTIRVDNVTTRNNLFVGSPNLVDKTSTTRAMDFSPQMTNCDFDYDGFAGGPFQTFARWNTVTYATLDELKAKGPVEKHARLVDAASLFATGVSAPPDVKTQFTIDVNDLRLKAGTAAIDAGAPLPNVNDGFRGRAPDLGAYEFGDKLPHYGPRPASVERAGPSAAEREFNNNYRDDILRALGG
jgi:hypothetical protein